MRRGWVLVLLAAMALAPSARAAVPCGSGQLPIHVCSFNGKIVGPTKLANTAVMDIFVALILRCDVFVLLEVQDNTGVVEPGILGKVQAVDPDWASLISPRSPANTCNTTGATEQIIVFYRPSILSVLASRQYDDGDVCSGDFIRDPFGVAFHPSLCGASAEADFFVVGTHTTPDSSGLITVYQVSNLSFVFDQMATSFGISSGVVVGDYNAGCAYLDVNTQWPLVLFHNQASRHWIIGDSQKTNVASSTPCPYDRIVASDLLFSRLQSSNVTYFNYLYGLNSTFTATVSDHFPVEAVFALNVPGVSSTSAAMSAAGSPAAALEFMLA